MLINVAQKKSVSVFFILGVLLPDDFFWKVASVVFFYITFQKCWTISELNFKVVPKLIDLFMERTLVKT